MFNDVIELPSGMALGIFMTTPTKNCRQYWDVTKYCRKMAC